VAGGCSGWEGRQHLAGVAAAKSMDAGEAVEKARVAMSL